MQCQRGGGLGAVDQGQALLGPELQRRDSSLLQHGQGRQALAVYQHFAFAHECQRHVGQRGQVTGGADRSFSRHIRHQPGVVHCQ